MSKDAFNRYLVVLEFNYDLTDPNAETEELVYFFINRNGEISYAGKKPVELTGMKDEDRITKERYESIIDTFRMRFDSTIEKMSWEGGEKDERSNHVEDALWEIQKKWKHSNWQINSVIGLNTYTGEGNEAGY